MKSIRKITGIFMAVAAIMALSGTAGFAKIAPQGAFGNAKILSADDILGTADIIILTQNHARTIAFSLDSPIGGAGGLHTLYLLTIGAGTLQITFVNNTPLKQGQEVIYFVAGLILSTPVSPVLQYVYSTGGTLSITAPLPTISGGILFTGVLYGTGGVDYPMTMSIVASLGN